MKKIIVFLPIFLLVASCREEVISPDNPTENINEPVTSTTEDSYSFLIIADNISYSVSNYTYLKSLRSSLFFSVADHKSGGVEITVYDEQKNILSINSVEENTPGRSQFIRGRTPHSVSLNFSNFSGKLNVRITRIN